MEQLQLQWLWKLFASDFNCICVTGMCSDEKSLTLLCALLGQIFGSSWSLIMKVWKTCFDILKWLSAGTWKRKRTAKGFGPAAAGEVFTFWLKVSLILSLFCLEYIISFMTKGSNVCSLGQGVQWQDHRSQTSFRWFLFTIDSKWKEELRQLKNKVEQRKAVSVSCGWTCKHDFPT